VELMMNKGTNIDTLFAKGVSILIEVGWN